MVVHILGHDVGPAVNWAQSNLLIDPLGSVGMTIESCAGGPAHHSPVTRVWMEPVSAVRPRPVRPSFPHPKRNAETMSARM